MFNKWAGGTGWNSCGNYCDQAANCGECTDLVGMDCSEKFSDNVKDVLGVLLMVNVLILQLQHANIHMHVQIVILPLIVMLAFPGLTQV